MYGGIVTEASLYARPSTEPPILSPGALRAATKLADYQDDLVVYLMMP